MVLKMHVFLTSVNILSAVSLEKKSIIINIDYNEYEI